MSNNLNEVGYVMPSGKVIHVSSAGSIDIGFCGDRECLAIHLFLLDHMDQPFAEATLTREQLEKMLELV